MGCFTTGIDIWHEQLSFKNYGIRMYGKDSCNSGFVKFHRQGQNYTGTS